MQLVQVHVPLPAVVCIAGIALLAGLHAGGGRLQPPRWHACDPPRAPSDAECEWQCPQSQSSMELPLASRLGVPIPAAASVVTTPAVVLAAPAPAVSGIAPTPGLGELRRNGKPKRIRNRPHSDADADGGGEGKGKPAAAVGVPAMGDTGAGAAAKQPRPVAPVPRVGIAAAAAPGGIAAPAAVPAGVPPAVLVFGIVRDAGRVIEARLRDLMPLGCDSGLGVTITIMEGGSSDDTRVVLDRLAAEAGKGAAGTLACTSRKGGAAADGAVAAFAAIEVLDEPAGGVPAELMAKVEGAEDRRIVRIAWLRDQLRAYPCLPCRLRPCYQLSFGVPHCHPCIIGMAMNGNNAFHRGRMHDHAGVTSESSPECSAPQLSYTRAPNGSISALFSLHRCPYHLFCRPRQPRHCRTANPAPGLTHLPSPPPTPLPPSRRPASAGGQRQAGTADGRLRPREVPGRRAAPGSHPPRHPAHRRRTYTLRRAK